MRVIVLDESGVLGRSLHKPNNKVIGIVCPQFAQSAWDKYNAISGVKLLSKIRILETNKSLLANAQNIFNRILEMQTEADGQIRDIKAIEAKNS